MSSSSSRSASVVSSSSSSSSRSGSFSGSSSWARMCSARNISGPPFLHRIPQRELLGPTRETLTAHHALMPRVVGHVHPPGQLPAVVAWLILRHAGPPQRKREALEVRGPRAVARHDVREFFDVVLPRAIHQAPAFVFDRRAGVVVLQRGVTELVVEQRAALYVAHAGVEPERFA